MPPHSLPPRRPSSPHAAAAADRPNEFAEAAARLFQERTKRLQADPPLPPIDLSEGEAYPSPLRRALLPMRDLRRALLIAPIAIAGYLAFWFLFMEPSAPAPPASHAIEAKAEARAAVEAAGPAAVRQDVVEVKATPPPQPEPVAPPPPAPPQSSTAPLTREEIKEMQGKLGAAGFAAGPVDGIVGPQTQAALQRYTQARSLPKPEPTQEVLSRLRAEVP
jgi:Putative peptidoglycan binding domain